MRLLYDEEIEAIRALCSAAEADGVRELSANVRAILASVTTTWHPGNYRAYAKIAVDGYGNLTRSTSRLVRVQEVPVGTASLEPEGEITVQLYTVPIDGRFVLRPRKD